MNTDYLHIAEAHQNQPLIQAGLKLDEAKFAMIMIHGRGATAEDILSISTELDFDKTAYLAPQAKDNTWYPYSFLSSIEKNEPELSSGLAVINSIIAMLNQKGFKENQIYLLGFSQGACLTLEYATRNPKKYGGIFGLSGGVIGEDVNLDSYSGNLEGTDVFLGCSDVDPHIPLNRVYETEEVFRKLNANVTKRIYKGMAHTVNQDEIDFVRTLLKKKVIK